MKGPEVKSRRAWLRATMVLVEQYRAVDPMDARVRLVNAHNLLDRRLFDEAEAELRAIEEGYDVLPESREDWRWAWLREWARLWDKRGDNERAEAAYRDLAVVAPEHTAGWIFLGGWLAGHGRLEEAEVVHRRATSLTGDVDEAYLNLGLVLRAQGRLIEAAEAFERALALCSDYDEASEALADVRAALELQRPPVTA